MTSSFAHTLRSLEHDREHVHWLLPALALLAAWSAWLLLARVEVQVSATRARLEVTRSAHRVAAEADGRIVDLRCELGRVVQRGELLALLDSSVERAELARGLSVLGGLEARLVAARAQIAAERARHRARARVDELSSAHADVNVQQAQVMARQREQVASITSQLHEQQLTSRLDAIAADQQLESSRLQLQDASLELERLRAAQHYEQSSERARLAELEREVAELEAERLVQSAALATTRAQIERHQLLAPASGKLGNVAGLQVGDVVQSGDVLASIIPEDDVRVVAEFAPEHAVGRILPGALASVRVSGFSWTEFGKLEARVTHLANEPQAGSIRVELAIVQGQGTRIPLQHGLTATVDVLLERVSPWALIQSSIGSRLTRSSARRALPGGLGEPSP